ncbi:MAG: putative tricarboxylic transport membrane protein [Granulosicoccus sp.]|jgi:putative tricarboxylic transport membrane protein
MCSFLLAHRVYSFNDHLMNTKNIQFRLGLGSLFFAAFLSFYLVPSWVTAPANVPRIVLSPIFWPLVLAGALALIGLGLLLSSRQLPNSVYVAEDSDFHRPSAIRRVVTLAVLMIGIVVVLPPLGLVLTTMLVILALGSLVKTQHPKTILVCAVLVPLVLYAFFAHVAGIAVPQGNFLRLP